MRIRESNLQDTFGIFNYDIDIRPARDGHGYIAVYKRNNKDIVGIQIFGDDEDAEVKVLKKSPQATDLDSTYDSFDQFASDMRYVKESRVAVTEADDETFVVVYKRDDSSWLIYPPTKSGVDNASAKEFYSKLKNQSNIKAVKIISYEGCFDKVAKANAGDKKAIRETMVDIPSRFTSGDDYTSDTALSALSNMADDDPETARCCICHGHIEGRGNNPQPLVSKGRCCDDCNRQYVLPLRLAQIEETKIDEATNQLSKLPQLHAAEVFKLFDYLYDNGYQMYLQSAHVGKAKIAELPDALAAAADKINANLYERNIALARAEKSGLISKITDKIEEHLYWMVNFQDNGHVAAFMFPKLIGPTLTNKLKADIKHFYETQTSYSAEEIENFIDKMVFDKNKVLKLSDSSPRKLVVRFGIADGDKLKDFVHNAIINKERKIDDQ